MFYTYTPLYLDIHDYTRLYMYLLCIMLFMCISTCYIIGVFSCRVIGLRAARSLVKMYLQKHQRNRRGWKMLRRWFFWDVYIMSCVWAWVYVYSCLFRSGKRIVCVCVHWSRVYIPGAAPDHPPNRNLCAESQWWSISQSFWNMWSQGFLPKCMLESTEIQPLLDCFIMRIPRISCFPLK